jgi:hypothetical protein
MKEIASAGRSGSLSWMTIARSHPFDGDIPTPLPEELKDGCKFKLPGQGESMSNRGNLSFIATTLVLLAGASPGRAQEPTQPPAEFQLRDAWRKSMVSSDLPKNGCFKVAYPSTEWQEVPCLPPPKALHLPRRPQGTGAGLHSVGAGGSNDYSAMSSGSISSATGSFLSVDTPVDGNTAFSMQLNSEIFYYNSPACNNNQMCQGLVQFIWSPPSGLCPAQGQSCVYIEYWLLGLETCPSGWGQPEAGSCEFSTAGVSVPEVTLANLAAAELTGAASGGGQDKVIFGPVVGTLYAEGNDSALNLALNWNTAEFNVFGTGDGNQAVFSQPTTLVIKTTIDDGTMNAPMCWMGSYTQETNSLNLVACCPYGGANPAIEFMETNGGPSHTAVCGPTKLEGDPHLTTLDGTRYDFQGAGEFVSLRDPDGQDIQTRQEPVSTTFIGTDNYDGLTTCVSLNTAVAARVGDHRLTYEPNLSGVPDPSGLQLRIDGVLTSLGASGLALGTGGRVVPSAGGALEVDFPDGKTLFVTPEWWPAQSAWYLNVDVSHHRLVSANPSPGVPSAGGIVGPLVAGSWLPALPKGESMGPMPATLEQRYVDLYKRFADAWRVDSKDSLFDYAPGTSTETFTNKNWPPRNPPCVVPGKTPVEPASEAVAQAACRRVTDKNRRADCVFDVRATGNPGFARTYLVTQRILADSTTTSLIDDANPSQAGEWVTFTAVVVPNSLAPAERPSGTIQFAVDGSNVGQPVTVDAKGRAQWKTSELKAGTHRVTASYAPGGDSTYLPSTSLEKLQTVKRCFCSAELERK